MRSAIQVPIILMSQNRQSEKDRITTAHQDEVNLKAKLEIIPLREKIDLLRQSRWTESLDIQKRQVDPLTTLAATKATGP